MMRGPMYDDEYISRKLASLQTTPTFLPPAPLSYGRASLVGGYLQPMLRYRAARSCSPNRLVYYYPRSLKTKSYYLPTPRTRVRYRSVSPVRTFVDYPPLPPTRLPARMPASYYDYDYGYGGCYGGYAGYPGYGYGYGSDYMRPIVGPRMSRYDSYLDDEYEVPLYTSRYGRATRLADSIIELEKEKQARLSPVRTITTTTYSLPQFTHTRSISPRLPGTQRKSRTKAIEEGSPTRLSKASGGSRYQPLSESQMLQDEVDKMRIRLKGLSYSLDPTGPVPDIIIPERTRRANSLEAARRYTSASMEVAELPRLSTRRHHVYPEDDYMKDNLRIKCLSHYKSTRSAAGYYKPKLYEANNALSNTYSSKYPMKSVVTTTPSASKWEEPDTIYSASTDKQPFSKVETGSSLYATSGYTSCLRDTVAEKVRDYYYYGDKTDSTVKFAESALKKTTETEEDESRKERRKKKKSKEREEIFALEVAPTTAAPVADVTPTVPKETSEPAPQTPEASAEADAEVDEKEKKRLEKKKRKAEREAAAKAAMEAELAALEAAEAELAQLEAEAGPPPKAAEVPAAAEPVPEEKASEPTPAKCESPTEVSSEAFPEPTPPEFESQPSLEPSLDTVVDEAVQDTHEVIDADVVHPESVDVIPEPIEPTQEPVEVLTEPVEVGTESTYVEAEPMDTVIADEEIPRETIEDKPVTEEPVVEAQTGPQIEEQVTSQGTSDDVEIPPQTDPEYEEPARKPFQSETDFDWGAFGDDTQEIGTGGDGGVTDEPVAEGTTDKVLEQSASHEDTVEPEE